MPIVLTQAGLNTLKSKPVVSPEIRDAIFKVLKLVKSNVACMDEVANHRLFNYYLNFNRTNCICSYRLFVETT